MIPKPFVIVLELYKQLRDNEILPYSLEWWFYFAFSTFLVLFGGIMSGLTLGLMSLNPLDVEILIRSGTAVQQRQAEAIFPVVTKQHQLLVTLLLCNAAAMEALPIFLDRMANPVVAILLSVSLVLLFGEIIPQAVCSRFGLSVGASCIWLVNILMFICFPIAFPIGKLLDTVLGHENPYFKRHQLKALVSVHAEREGKGGDLTYDETMIISGALDLTTKTAEQAMTPIQSTFSLDVNSTLDKDLMKKIVERGHSRVPVYRGVPSNIIGVLLVKSLITVRPEDGSLVGNMHLRKIPRMSSNMPLYEVLNEFQKGLSHMAVVVRTKETEKSNSSAAGASEDLSQPLLADPKEEKVRVVNDLEKGSVIGAGSPSNTSLGRGRLANVVRGNEVGLRLRDVNDGCEVIGIITLEDVMEELLQEEIVDETDEYIDVHKKIRVAAAIMRLPSGKNLRSLVS